MSFSSTRSAGGGVRCGFALATALAVLAVPVAGPAAGKRGAKKASQPYALIFGTVWGAGNHPLYGVKIKIRREGEKKARWELISDHAGEFAQRVPPGSQDYVVWADVKTRKGKAPPQVKVHVNNDERVDISLRVPEPNR